MAGAIPSVDSAPSSVSDAAAGVSAAIALLLVMGVVVARRSRPTDPFCGLGGADRDGPRVVRYRPPPRAGSENGDVDIEAGLGPAPATRRWPLARRLWPGPAAPPRPPRSVRPLTPTCPICTDDFIRGAMLQELPCGHLFHPACITRWLHEFGVTCPLWRVFSTPSRPFPLPSARMLTCVLPGPVEPI